jgi:hypothetical protein
MYGPKKVFETTTPYGFGFEKKNKNPKAKMLLQKAHYYLQLLLPIPHLFIRHKNPGYNQTSKQCESS